MPPSNRIRVLGPVHFTGIAQNMLVCDLICRRILRVSLPTDILLSIYEKTIKEERKLKKQNKKKKQQLPYTPESGNNVYYRDKGARRKRCKTKVKIKRAMRYSGR